jgi:hypothetical protein
MNTGPNFPITSRYYGIEVAKFTTADGDEIAYLRRRFIPLPDRYVTLQEHVVTQDERPDNVTFRFFGDAEQFWRLADPNTVLRPEELTETAGRRLRITLAEGIPG